MADEVRDNPEEHRFELMVEGQRAKPITRRRQVMTFTHTDVPNAVRPRIDRG